LKERRDTNLETKKEEKIQRDKERGRETTKRKEGLKRDVLGGPVGI